MINGVYHSDFFIDKTVFLSYNVSINETPFIMAERNNNYCLVFFYRKTIYFINDMKGRIIEND